MADYPTVHDNEASLLKKIATNSAQIADGSGGGGGGGAAADTSYDNSTSGLTATEVQAAIDEAVDLIEERLVSIETSVTDGQVVVYNGTGGKSGKKATGTGMARLNDGVMTAVPVAFRITFNPKAVCDGTIDRLFLMTVGPDFPSGLVITRWNLSFDADPATEVDLDFKRADAFIGVANSAVVDVLDTTNGASSETTAGNINAGATIANGKVLYLEFGTPYTDDNLQMIFEFWGYAA
jgi:hypothetical protein